MSRIKKVCKQICAALMTFWPLIVWITVNYGIFKNNYIKYKDAPEYYYLRKIIGRGLCISRATATMLNLSCCLLVLPICRSINLLSHSFLSLFSRHALMFWIRNAKTFHIICASTVVLESVVHTISHCINAVNFSQHYDENHPSLNWAEYLGQPPWEMIFTSVVGITGVIMVCLLSVITITSLKCIREKHYQTFWIVHHLYLPFLIILLCHPLSGKLKEQAVSQNFVDCRKQFLNGTVNQKDSHYQNQFNNSFLCENRPVFKAMKSETWMWIIPPLLLIVVDRIFWSLKRNWKQLKVLQVARLPGSAIHLVLQSPSKKFFCRPGQYVLLQCPVISAVEWHPFSVMSFHLSEEPSLSVLIRAKGDWTEELLSRVLVPFDQIHTTQLCDQSSKKPVTFLVDGPFRSPLEGVLNSSVAICIAGGIGITPFISVLNYLLNSPVQSTPRCLHLLWMLHDSRELVWCATLLCDLHEKFWNANLPDKFSIQLHITRNYNAVNIQKIMDEKTKLLVQRIWKGRPNWHEIFNQMKEMYLGHVVHVYTSGPKSLITEVETWCKKMKGKGLAVKYDHEIF